MTMPPSGIMARQARKVKMMQWKTFKAPTQSITAKAVEVQARTPQEGTFEKKGKFLEKEAQMADERRCKLPFHSCSAGYLAHPQPSEFAMLDCT